MVRKRRILVVTIVALSLAACSNDESDATTTEPPVELPAETAAIEDDADDQSATGPPYEVSQSTISHETTQQIAVWAPTADGAWPIITIAHGMGGSHQNMAETASRLAQEGFVVFAADYRSTLGAPPDPAQIEKDVECGFRYSLSVAEEYGGDPTLPITFVGFSFGATVAMEGALNADYGPDGTYDDCFSGVRHADLVVGLAGCYIETPDGFDTGFDPDRHDAASAGVAIVLVGGSEDDECEAWQSSQAAGVLADSGFDTTYKEIEGSNHFEIIFHDIVNGEYVTVADAPEGEEAVQIILEAMASQPSDTATRDTATVDATTNEETTGFSSERDDLCEWVTDDEVVEFVTAAGFTVEVPATASEPATEDTTGWDCAWTFASGEELQLGVRNHPGRLDSLQELDMIVEYQEPGQIMEPGTTVSGHPALSDGVVVENNAFGRFAFYTPGRDDVLNVMFWTDNGAYEEGYEAAFMAMSDSVLSDLGWVPD